MRKIVLVFLHTRQNKLWKGTLSSLRASSPFGDIVKSIPSRGTREETRKRGAGERLFPRPLAARFARSSGRDYSKAIHSLANLQLWTPL